MSRRIVSLTVGLFLLVLASPSFAQNTITCSSDNMRRNYCDIGQNGGVRLLRQRSDAQCIEGQTWGYNRNQVWVDRGCRADFEVLPWRGGYNGNPNQGGAQTVTCSSDNMRRNYCNVGENGGVRLLRQRSDARCVEGQTWGSNRNQIWVDRGCRADFTVLPIGGGWNGRPDRDHRDYDHDRDRDHDNYGGGNVTTVYCASDDMHRNYCNVGRNRGVTLIHQRSDARCILNQTYGFDRDRIWVDRGCRADFQVTQR